VLAKQRTDVEAERVYHRVFEQYSACSPPLAPGRVDIVDPAWLTQSVSLSLTPDELCTAALACRVAALEFASSMSEFAIISPAFRLGRLPTIEELESLARQLEHPADSR
jgi:hypothetical protein